MHRRGSKWDEWSGPMEVEVHSARVGRFSSHTSFVLGHGARLKFWSELWCGTTVVKEAFPSIFRLANENEASVTIF